MKHGNSTVTYIEPPVDQNESISDLDYADEEESSIDNLSRRQLFDFHLELRKL